MSRIKHFHSLSRRLPIMISLSFLILLSVAVLITYLRVEQRMVNEYKQMADGVTNLMIDVLDIKKMDYYIEENYSSPEYMRIMKYYYQLKDNYPDVYYLYVYRFYKDENNVPKGTIIFDLEDEYTENPNQVSIDWVGSIYDVLEPFASRINEMLESNEPVYDTAFSMEDGYLLSLAKPIFDEDGNYVASACVDFSLAELHAQNIHFIHVLSFSLIFVSVVILLLSIYGLKQRVTKPLMSISDTVMNFKYDNENDRNTNLDKLKNLNLKSDNEIGVLYKALLKSEEDSAFYLRNYIKAEDEIHVRDEKIHKLGDLALRDAMTNVGNKASFTNAISDIRDEDEYGIVIMDANNLKMINDNYGHESGDEYIKGCCNILCDTFTHSPVFRIGGDEFAVILKGRDYANRQKLMEDIKETFEKIWIGMEQDPVHRFSGSVGMADSTTCKTPRETIKTADENMYENKRLFKEKYGSYR